MLSVLRNRSYRRLFLAQIVALAGTGLATIALGLLAFDLAGGDAGRVLGTALAIKMIAYVTVAPIAAAWFLFPRPSFIPAAIALLAMVFVVRVVVQRTRSIAFLEAELFDDAGVLLARATSSARIMDGKSDAASRN